MTPKVAAHPWSEESLIGKAVLYVERMESVSADDWQYPFWSALSLEFVARAAIAHISPVLLADGANWRNITYALHLDPTTKRFSPASIGTKGVLARLNELVPAFTQEVASFCTQHISKRNSELHTGELAFIDLKMSEWQPKFYLACKILLESMNRDLSDLVPDSAVAKAMIASLEDTAAKAVKGDIKAHFKVWSNKSDKEREDAVIQSTTWASRQTGHRVVCPACESPGLSQGQHGGSIETELDGDEVVQHQTVLPSTFQCIACGLRISGLSKLLACGLGDVFTATFRFSAAEFFELYTEDEIEEARRQVFEPDFND